MRARWPRSTVQPIYRSYILNRREKRKQKKNTEENTDKKGIRIRHIRIRMASTRAAKANNTNCAIVACRMVPHHDHPSNFAANTFSYMAMACSSQAHPPVRPTVLVPYRIFIAASPSKSRKHEGKKKRIILHRKRPHSPAWPFEYGGHIRHHPTIPLQNLCIGYFFSVCLTTPLFHHSLPQFNLQHLLQWLFVPVGHPAIFNKYNPNSLTHRISY